MPARRVHPLHSAVPGSAETPSHATTGERSDAPEGAQRGVRTLLRMRAHEGSERAFEEAVAAVMGEISEIPGNVRQDLMRDVSDPRTYLIVGDWTDRATLDAFGRSPARERLLASVRELRESADRTTYELLRTVAGRVPETAPSRSLDPEPGVVEQGRAEKQAQSLSARNRGRDVDASA